MKKRLLLATVLLLIPVLCTHADSRIDQHTQTELGGSLGKVASFLGGQKAREGMSQEIRVRGDQMLTRTGRHGELIDLAAEKIYKIDFKKRRYEVTTFDELRQQMAQMKESLGGALPWQKQPSSGGEASKPEGPEYVAEMEVDETGAEELIAGHKCKEVIITITVHPKGQSLEEGGGAVLTAATWQGPKLPEITEWNDFQRRYAEKLGLFGDSKQAGQEIAQTLMGSPALQQAMKEFEQHQKSFEGSSLRTVTTLETVAGSNPPAGAQGAPQGEAEEAPSIGGMLRGLGGKFRRRGSDQEASGGNAATGPGGRNMAFRSTSEIRTVTPDVSASEVAIPGEFKEKKRRH